jgi:hypothetical protein
MPREYADLASMTRVSALERPEISHVIFGQAFRTRLMDDTDLS